MTLAEIEVEARRLRDLNPSSWPLFHGVRSCPWPSTGCCYDLPLAGSDLGSVA